jgi:5-methylcytosine-specific restriction enzyme A
VSPTAPQHPCTYPGCSALVTGRRSRCEKHQTLERSVMENRRGSANSRGYGSRWRIARKRFLNLNPLCSECNHMGRLTAATIVDHIFPHKGDAALFWNQSNWQSLCRRCHNRKTAASDGRWG